MKSESPNLHRHQKNQKNQTTRCTKPAQAPKKPKKLKIPGTMGPLLSSCWNFWFFWFFWCLSMFGASSGLVFLVFLVPVNVLWSQSHQTCTGTKKTKKIKPLDAPNLGTMGPLLSSCWNFCFFFFFGACRCLVHLVVCFFCFFWCLSMFLYISCQDHDEKNVFY